MANYSKLHDALRAEVIADLKKLIDENGEIVFYDLETEDVYIDLSVAGRDINGCYPDVTKIWKEDSGRYYVSCIDSDYDTFDIDIEWTPDLSLGDLCEIYDAAVIFLAGDRKPRFSRK